MICVFLTHLRKPEHFAVEPTGRVAIERGIEAQFLQTAQHYVSYYVADVLLVPCGSNRKRSEPKNK